MTNEPVAASSRDGVTWTLLVFKYRRLGTRSRAPEYSVEANGVNVGVIRATTSSPYPGRSRASYLAFPQGANPYRFPENPRKLGPFDSRAAAAHALVAYLGRYAYGRKILAKAAVSPHARVSVAG